MSPLLRAAAVCALLALPSIARAQEPTAPAPQRADTIEALHLFLDCQARGCDFDFLRTDLTWVNYVRDRTAADVHVIATSLNTGSGGEEVTLKFIGLKAFAGLDDEVKFATPQGATNDEMRREMSRVLKVGLGRYLLHTRGGGKNISLRYVAPEGNAAAAQHPHDPWNFWVFSVGMNGDLEAESQNKGRRLSGSLSSVRTTADWKFEAGFSGSTSRSTYQLTDSTDYIAKSHSYRGDGLLVRSVGDHASIGGTFTGSSSSQQNIDLRIRVARRSSMTSSSTISMPGAAWSRSTDVGYNLFRYTDTTIYNRTRETRIDHQLSLSYSATQPWGNVNVGISGSNYLSNFAQYRASVFGGTLGADRSRAQALVEHAVFARARPDHAAQGRRLGSRAAVTAPPVGHELLGVRLLLAQLHVRVAVQ